MLKVFYKFIFINMFILSFFSISSFANVREVFDCSTNVFSNQKEILVGLLRTEKETYNYEWASSDKICEMLVSMGANVVLVDYNKIFNIAKKEALSEAKGDVVYAEQLESNKIKEVVRNFIKDNKINRILLPGNYYNLDSDPLPPTPNRQLVTEAVVKIIDEDPSISLFAICGGLQGVMHAKGVEMIRVGKLINVNEQEAHLISMLDPQQKDIHLHRIKIVPESRLGKIASKFMKLDENGWFSIYSSDTHIRVLDTSNQNKQKLEYLGYKIVGFSDDGVIEAVEDKYGNLYFQDHLETLVIKPDKNYHAKEKEREIATLMAIAILNDFL